MTTAGSDVASVMTSGGLHPQVRTATYAVIARSVLCWGGVGDQGQSNGRLHVIDYERQRAREVHVREDPGVRGECSSPRARGGAVAVPLSPVLVLVLCGGDHPYDDEADVLTSHFLKLALE